MTDPVQALDGLDLDQRDEYRVDRLWELGQQLKERCEQVQVTEPVAQQPDLTHPIEDLTVELA